MAPTITDLRDIYETTASDAAIDFWISAAGDLLDDAFEQHDVGPSVRERIHRLVAVHFLAAEDPTLSEGSVGQNTHKYEGAGDLTGLAETRYGRRALSLDPTGALATHSREAPEIEFFGAPHGAYDD